MSGDDLRILMGNEALGRGLVENGCTLVASYPGTPASEILQSVVRFAGEEGVDVYTEWSVNEKVALEAALAHSYTGLRSAVAMKQVGLNVASDPFLRSAYLGVAGGLVIIAADDPGPHSSQTEQDSRFYALFAKVPVFDPVTPGEAREMVGRAFELSERYEIPVVIRPTTRICHARQNVPCDAPRVLGRKADFKKDPARWAATPRFIAELHRRLNVKIEGISGEERYSPTLISGDGTRLGECLIASGAAYAHTHDRLLEMGLLGRIDLFRVGMPYPLNRDFTHRINALYDRILVVEESYPVIEMQLASPWVMGRRSKSIPGQGELTPDLVGEALEKFLDRTTKKKAPAGGEEGIRPTMCAGCSHRAAFYAIKQTFPGGIYPSDIGCYTLGMNLGAVDTVHCMGSAVGQAAGFYRAYKGKGNDFPAIVATIGDSTFFHSGIPALVNAVHNRARFVLVILDNSTTAMTGGQPTPQTGMTASGEAGGRVLITDLVEGCGVGFLREEDPYEMEDFSRLLLEADRYIRSPEGGVAVIIARHPCVLEKEAVKSQPAFRMHVAEDCSGCRVCLDQFECPALVMVEETGKVVIDELRCIGCGVCAGVCPQGAIVSEGSR